MRVELPVTVIDSNGNAVQGASVAVSYRAGGTAPVYAGATGSTQVANPLTTDANGRVAGWVERGQYDLVVSKVGLTTYTEYFDAAAAGDAGIDSTWLGTGAVQQGHIADGAVVAAKIADGAVTAAKIPDASITSAKLADAAMVPVGAVLDWPWASGKIPSWAVLPYGQGITNVSHPVLHQLAVDSGYPHGGSGNNSTLPDYRGRSGVGLDNMGGSAASRITVGVSGINGATLGAVGGAEGITLSTAQLPAHNHGLSGSPSISDPSHRHGMWSSNADGSNEHNTFPDNQSDNWQERGVQTKYASTGISVGAGSLSVGNTGSGSAHANVQPTIMVNKMMRAL